MQERKITHEPEILQQSKIRKLGEGTFHAALSPILVEAIRDTYTNSPPDVQNKIHHVVLVWKERGVLDPTVQAELEKEAVAPTLKSKDLMVMAPELEHLASLQWASSKAKLAFKSAHKSLDDEYRSLHLSQADALPPPEHAARLNALHKNLGLAEVELTKSIHATKSVTQELRKLLHENERADEEAQALAKTLASQQGETEQRKHVIEDAIMRGLAPPRRPSSPGVKTQESKVKVETHDGNNDEETEEPERPEMEPLTPPPAENFNAPSEPVQTYVRANDIEGDRNNRSTTPTDSIPPWLDGSSPVSDPRMRGQYFNMPQQFEQQTSTNKRPSEVDVAAIRERMDAPKRRKTSGYSPTTPTGKGYEEALFAGGDAMEDLDDEVKGMLGEQGQV